MRIAGSTVGIVGGSIAGCAAATALARLGCEVEVFERSSGELRDRGSGIAIPLALRDELIATGYLPADYPICRPTSRHWVHLGDGDQDHRTGHLLWEQPSAGAMSNWGVLWRSLRANVPDDRYHDGAKVTGLDRSGGAAGASITFADGTVRRFDLVLGADGYRSRVRSAIVPGAVPSYAGYVLWRGNFPEAELTDRTAIDRLDAAGAWLTVCFDGGHGVMYPIPDFVDGGDQPGRRRINWAIYAPSPDGLEITEPTSIPPGAVTEEWYGELQGLLERDFPTELRPLFASPRDEVSIQPIYDQLVDTYVDGRVVLIGDAGTVTRPHTGSGATKAMQDARCLEVLGERHDEWEPMLAEYDHDRVASGRSLVDLGRRIGRDQVEDTPPWATMTPDDFDSWTTGTLSGEHLYFWGNQPART